MGSLFEIHLKQWAEWHRRLFVWHAQILASGEWLHLCICSIVACFLLSLSSHLWQTSTSAYWPDGARQIALKPRRKHSSVKSPQQLRNNASIHFTALSTPVAVAELVNVAGALSFHSIAAFSKCLFLHHSAPIVFHFLLLVLKPTSWHIEATADTVAY